MTFPFSTRANGVISARRVDEIDMMSKTSTPAMMSASVINRRLHRHGTASLHMIGRYRLVRDLPQLGEPGTELPGRHIVSVVTEGLDPPSAIGAPHTGRWVPAAAEIPEPPISDIGGQRILDRVLVSLRVLPRRGKTDQRTSTTVVTSLTRSIASTSSKLRVECPMVNTRVLASVTFETDNGTSPVPTSTRRTLTAAAVRATWPR